MRQPPADKPDEAQANDPFGGLAADPGQGGDPGPTGAGWVFEFRAHHYYNHRDKDQDQGMNYLRRTLLVNLLDKEITLTPDQAKQWGLRKFSDPRPDPVKVKPADLGIKYPVLIDVGAIDWNYEVEVDDPAVKVAPGMPAAKKRVKAPRFNVRVQFVWQEVLPDSRLEPPPAADAVVAGR
jgi:hypothetical protein